MDVYVCLLPSCKDQKQKVREKSRECHNQKPRPFPDTEMKRKQTKPKKRKSNKRTKRTIKISSSSPKLVNRNANRTENTQEQNNTR